MERTVSFVDHDGAGFMATALCCDRTLRETSPVQQRRFTHHEQDLNSPTAVTIDTLFSIPV